MSTRTKPVSNPQESAEDTTFVIVPANEWEPTKHNIGTPKANKQGKGNTANLSYLGKRFFLRTPAKLLAPFGASKPFEGKSDQQDQPQQSDNQTSKAYTLQLALPSEFEDKVNEFDQFIPDHVLTKFDLSNPDLAKAWGANTITHKVGTDKFKTVFESRYTLMKKVGKKKPSSGVDYPPMIRVQFINNYNHPELFTTEFYDAAGKQITATSNPLDDNYICKVIPPQTHCSLLLSASVWVTGQGFGVTWKIQQARIYVSKGIQLGRCLLDDPVDDEEADNDSTQDEDENEDEIENENVVSSNEPSVSNTESNKDADENVDVDVEVEVEEEDRQPTPPPVKAKPILKTLGKVTVNKK
jgi:hypothetical protein